MDDGPIIVTVGFYIAFSSIVNLISFITSIKLWNGENVDPALPLMSFFFTTMSLFFLYLVFFVVYDKINKFNEWKYRN